MSGARHHCRWSEGPMVGGHSRSRCRMAITSICSWWMEHRRWIRTPRERRGIFATNTSRSWQRAEEGQLGTFLPDETRLDHVHLRTNNLERALAFYTGTLGLSVVEDGGSDAALGAAADAAPIIRQTEAPEASPRLKHTLGLFHLAIRFPTRRDLASAVNRLLNNNYAIEGASDHGVSEAVYLSDPDNNGLELYVDRPRSQWTWRDGQVAMGTDPLDVRGFIATISGAADSPARVPRQTDLGHIH